MKRLAIIPLVLASLLLFSEAQANPFNSHVSANMPGHEKLHCLISAKNA